MRAMFLYTLISKIFFLCASLIDEKKCANYENKCRLDGFCLKADLWKNRKK